MTCIVCDKFGNIVELVADGYIWVEGFSLTVSNKGQSIANFWNPEWAVLSDSVILKNANPIPHDHPSHQEQRHP